MNEYKYRDWRAVVDLAFDRTGDEFRNSAADPGVEEYVGTFRFHYDELMAETRITMWPVDPSASHRMAEQKAAYRHAETY